MAAALDEVADMQTRSGKSDAALASFNQALVLQREIGQKQETADTLTDIGTVYQDRGDYDQALKTYKEALQIQRESGDQSAEALSLNNSCFGAYVAGRYGEWVYELSAGVATAGEAEAFRVTLQRRWRG